MGSGSVVVCSFFVPIYRYKILWSGVGFGDRKYYIFEPGRG